MKKSTCYSCGKEIEVYDGYEPEYCCSGLKEQCGCMGEPINPLFCDDCEKKIYGLSLILDAQS